MYKTTQLKCLWYFFSESDTDDKLDKNEQNNIPSVGSVRKVTFQTNEEKKSITSPSRKTRRGNLNKTKRSFDSSISFSGRNTIYTAGIFLIC